MANKQEQGHITRSVKTSAEQDKKNKFLNMSPNEKRKLYHCGDDYVELKDIYAWPEHAKHNKLPSDRNRTMPFAKKALVDLNIASKVSIWSGDITWLEIDAIVNAANSSLLGGGGVDGAIHRAAGNGLYCECKTLHGCRTGEAKITGGYKLPAKYVIHTVGPMDRSEMKLRNCYKTSLRLLLENNLRSVAFPCISTGIYGYPNEHAAHVALQTARDFLEKNSNKVDRIIFCLFLPLDVQLYETFMPVYFPLDDGSSGDVLPSTVENDQQNDTGDAKNKPATTVAAEDVRQEASETITKVQSQPEEASLASNVPNSENDLIQFEGDSTPLKADVQNTTPESLHENEPFGEITGDSNSVPLTPKSVRATVLEAVETPESEKERIFKTAEDTGNEEKESQSLQRT